MSDAAQLEEINPIVKIREQLEHFVKQREQLRVQHEQLNGAIFACEQVLIALLNDKGIKNEEQQP